MEAGLLFEKHVQLGSNARMLVHVQLECTMPCWDIMSRAGSAWHSEVQPA